MNKKILLDRIIGFFLGDEEISEELEENVRLWEDIRKNRDIIDIPENILTDEDKFLRLDLINRKLTDGERLATIDKTLGSLHTYSNKLALWNGDITTIYADVVVNPTTSLMLKGEDFEVDSIGYNVFLRSGMRLGLKCKSIIREEQLDDSDVLVTRAYNLPCDYIIHVVLSSLSDDLTDEDEKIISMCYMNVLECAKNNMAKTIVIPCIGFEFCHNKEKLSKIAIDTIVKFLDGNKDVFDKIILQVNNEDLYNKYSELLGDNYA